MALADELERIARAAAGFAAPDEQLAGVLAAEPLAAGRVYLCAFESAAGRTWLALDDGGRPLASREAVRGAASLAALCEVAEERAGGGDLPELRARLAELRETEAAAAALADALEPEPRVATAEYLDRLGAASRRLEQALGDETGSPFAAALQQALSLVEELADDVEQHYKGPLA